MYKIFKETNVEIDDNEVERLRLFNVFVFGLPRSGTSMMTGICERLGVKMVHTSDTPEMLTKRNETERKRYGDAYQMNEAGFYEITENLWDNLHKIMATPYSGCKMIIPVTKDRMMAVQFNPKAKVIMMWRDPEEMRQSQQASYKGNQGITPEQAEIQRAIIQSKLVHQQIQLERLGIDVLHIEYQDVLHNTEEKVKEIAKFINAPNSVDEAVEWVQPEKNRFKKEDLTENI